MSGECNRCIRRLQCDKCEMIILCGQVDQVNVVWEIDLTDSLEARTSGRNWFQ